MIDTDIIQHGLIRGTTAAASHSTSDATGVTRFARPKIGIVSVCATGAFGR
jgi:hypothetical protein